MAKYINSHLKKQQLPTIEQIGKYLEQSRSIDLKVRDTRPLNSFFQRLPQVDNRFLGLLFTRKIALLGFPYTIKFDDDIKPDATEQKNLDELKRRFIATKMHSTFNTIAAGIAAGRSALRLVWGYDDTLKNFVQEKTSYELTELDFSFDSNDRLDIIETDNSNKLSRQPLDPDTHIYVRYNPMEGIANHEFIGSVLQSNMLLVWLKYTDLHNWGSANEKFGDPMRYATYNKSASAEDIATVLDGLKNLGTDSYAAFPDDIKVQLLEAMRNGIADMHEKLIDTLNTETAISVLGQTLTTDVSKIGSFAAAKVHNFVRQDILYGDLLLFENILSDQYVRRDWTLNYGEPKNGYPRFRFITDEIVDFESNARVAEAAASIGLEVKAKQLYDKLGYELPDTIKPDDLIKLTTGSALASAFNTPT